MRDLSMRDLSMRDDKKRIERLTLFPVDMQWSVA